MDENSIIIECKITPMPKSMFDPMPEVMVKTSGDEDYTSLFSYYPDEISFSESEFIGKTVAQAKALRHERDVAYLRS